VIPDHWDDSGGDEGRATGRGEETLVPSEVTVAEIMAVKRKDENSRGTEKEN
jgi:hypothetical protein